MRGGLIAAIALVLVAGATLATISFRPDPPKSRPPIAMSTCIDCQSCPQDGCCDGRCAAPPLRGVPEDGVVPAPIHHVGEAWTYEGTFEYNSEKTMKIVVGASNASGYLFTAGEEKMLVYEAMWGDPLLGPHDLAMARSDFKRVPLAFPLADGATWAWSPRINVTAHAADITTPRGHEPGFMIAGSDDHADLRYDYSPAIGAIVGWRLALKDGTILDDWKMTKVEDGQKGVWYERGAIAEISGPDKSAAFDVPSGEDAVLVSAGGANGARAIVQGPDGSQFAYGFNDKEAWQNAMLPGSAGKWIATMAAHNVHGAPTPPVDWPIGWAYVHAAPVKWIRS